MTQQRGHYIKTIDVEVTSISTVTTHEILQHIYIYIILMHIYRLGETHNSTSRVSISFFIHFMGSSLSLFIAYLSFLSPFLSCLSWFFASFSSTCISIIVVLIGFFWKCDICVSKYSNFKSRQFQSISAFIVLRLPFGLQ